jgi:putative transcriptional regulator
MSPSHHPHPETLISYVSGALPSSVACIVACHLSMCTECADEVRWLERLGGLLLSSLQTDDAQPAPTKRGVAQVSTRPQPGEPGRKPMAKVEDLLLPRLLARYIGVNEEKTSWAPAGSGVQERLIELPKCSCSIKLRRMSPGKCLPEHDVNLETEVALVLQGACCDRAGTYVRGDIIERSEDLPHPPIASGEAGCICLIADQACR